MNLEIITRDGGAGELSVDSIMREIIAGEISSTLGIVVKHHLGFDVAHLDDIEPIERVLIRTELVQESHLQVRDHVAEHEARAQVTHQTRRRIPNCVL